MATFNQSSSGSDLTTALPAVNAGGTIADDSTSTVAGDKVQLQQQQQGPQLCHLSNLCPTTAIKLCIEEISSQLTCSDVCQILERYGTCRCLSFTPQESSLTAIIEFDRICAAELAMQKLSDNDDTVDDRARKWKVNYATGEQDRLGFVVLDDMKIHEAKLYVASLPRLATVDEIRTQFESFGEILDIAIIKEPGTQQGRGCAFVHLSCKECALWAINTLNGLVTFPGCGEPLQVRFALGKKLQIRHQAAVNYGLMTDMTLHSGIGVIGGSGMKIGSGGPVLDMPARSEVPRQIGPWKEYFNDQGRTYFYNEITKQSTWDVPPEFGTIDTNVITVGGMSGAPGAPQVGRAPGGNTPGSDVAGPPGANVFIFHVPNEWSQTELLHAFAPWGNIVSARVAVDKVTQRNKGYAFVSYDNIQSAAKAVQQMNGYMAGSKRLKVSIKQGEEQYVAHLTTTTASNITGSFQGGPQLVNPNSINRATPY